MKPQKGKSFLAAILIFAFHCEVAIAMEFKIYYQPVLKQNLVVAEGEITQGDAERFIAIAKVADRDSEGHIQLVLNSPGGSVKAAFDLVSAMDKIGVFTVVPDNARCASACASIVFASGTRRNVIGTGLLGFHSCYKIDKTAVNEDALCNEIIGKNAFERGLDYASVDVFTSSYGAKDMAWVGKDIACTMLIGLCKPSLVHKNTVEHNPVSMINRIADSHRKFGEKKIVPSFDCNAGTSIQEQIICNDNEISQLDNQMSQAYLQLKLNTKDINELRRQQHAWIKYSRNTCLNKYCLIKTYKIRIAELTQ